MRAWCCRRRTASARWRLTSGMLPACRARMKAIRGVQMAAKGVGEAFTGGRDLHQMLHALRSTTISVEAYFSQPSFERVLPDNLKQWAASLCGEAKEAYKRLKKRVEEMEKDGVRGAAESTFHAVSSAAGAITGIAMLDVGRHIADELLQTTAALNDVLARATRLVTLANCAMLEKLAEDKGLTLPTAMEVNPLLTKLEIDNIRARIWVHQIEDGSVVAGDKMSVTWDTIGQVPLVNVRLKNSMGVETSRGKTVQRLTVEAGEPNKGFVNDVLPLDFVPGKYTVAVSDPSNNIRGMAFVSVLRPISVAEILEPVSGMGRSLSAWRAPTWNRGTSHKISWRMNRGKLKFKVPDTEPRDEGQRRTSGSYEQAASTEESVPARRPSERNGDTHADQSASDEESDHVVWGPSHGEGAGKANPREHPEWFSDESVSKPRSKAVAHSVTTTFAGLISGSWTGSSEVAPSQPPAVALKPNRPNSKAPTQTASGVSLGIEVVSDEYHLADTHCLDCSFDWFVPVEIEPGKYVFRVAPVSHLGPDNVNLRFSEKEQTMRSKDSAFVTIS